MQHIGDLQPLRQPDFLADHAPLGRYSAKRSRWRFAVGSLEVGFDRATERLHAETQRPVHERPRADFGQRVMMIVGVLTTICLTVALVGWLLSSRGISFGGETVSASIVDRGAAVPIAQFAAPTTKPILIPTKKQPEARLSALIEQRKPAPAVAPAPTAAVEIAKGEEIKPKSAAAPAKPAAAPDQAIIASGNYLLIPSVSRAVSLAMTSGDAQSWTAGGYHGVVVVGDADARDGKSCRQGTILLRDGSNQGRTQSFDRCI